MAGLAYKVFRTRSEICMESFLLDSKEDFYWGEKLLRGKFKRKHVGSKMLTQNIQFEETLQNRTMRKTFIRSK